MFGKQRVGGDVTCNKCIMRTHILGEPNAMYTYTRGPWVQVGVGQCYRSREPGDKLINYVMKTR